MNYDNWEDFKNEWDVFTDFDVDLNLIFRWDIQKNVDDETDEELDSFRIIFFMIQQRKGIFKVVEIENVNEEDLPEIQEFLNWHWLKLNKIWDPISKIKEQIK